MVKKWGVVFVRLGGVVYSSRGSSRCSGMFWYFSSARIRSPFDPSSELGTRKTLKRQPSTNLQDLDLSQHNPA